MNREAEPNEQLEKLLALKRHEQPPPGYFRGLSNNIITRLESGDPGGQGHWLVELWLNFTSRPLLAAAVGGVMVAVLIFGFATSHNQAPAPLAGQGPANASWDLGSPATTPPAFEPVYGAVGASPNEPTTSTNPIAASSPMPSLFKPVSFQAERTTYQRRDN